MTNTTQPRQPQGVPAGGQFAASVRPAAAASLVEVDENDLDEDERKELGELNAFLATLSEADLEVAKDLLESDWDEDELTTYRSWEDFHPGNADSVCTVAEKRISQSDDDTYFELSRDLDGDLTGWAIEIPLGGKIEAGLNKYTSFSEDCDEETGFAGALALAKRMDGIAKDLAEGSSGPRG